MEANYNRGSLACMCVCVSGWARPNYRPFGKAAVADYRQSEKKARALTRAANYRRLSGASHRNSQELLLYEHTKYVLHL